MENDRDDEDGLDDDSESIEKGYGPLYLCLYAVIVFLSFLETFLPPNHYLLSQHSLMDMWGG